MKKNEILRSYGTDYKEMTKRLLDRADLAGEIRRKTGPVDAGGAEAGPRIGIKPNLVTPAPAEFGGTTHPEIAAGIIEYLQEHGYSRITIAEGSWVGDRTEEAFEYCGYRELSERYDVPLLDTQKDAAVPADAAGMELSVCQCVRDFDFLINVPVLKGHCQTHVTCALKNMKGLIPNREKRRFHTLGLHEPIARLNTVIRPDLIVIDHICGDPDFEEGGDPLVRNCIMAALDPVLTDAYACRLLGWSPEEVPYIGMAEKLGVGSADLSALQLITCEGDDSGDLPLEHRLLSVAYPVEDSDSCSACYAMLLPALDRLREEGLLDRLDVPVAIGQGHRGREGILGVGDCTRRFQYCVKGCPPGEEEMYRGLKEYIESKARS